MKIVTEEELKGLQEKAQTLRGSGCDLQMGPYPVLQLIHTIRVQQRALEMVCGEFCENDYPIIVKPEYWIEQAQRELEKGAAK